MAQVGQRLLGRLCELAWEEVDAEAVARYTARQAPGSVVADGEATLAGDQPLWHAAPAPPVVAHCDGRLNVLPGNAFLPAHQGIPITRGLREMACLLPQDVPFVTAARLLGWWAGEPGLLCAPRRGAPWCAIMAGASATWSRQTTGTAGRRRSWYRCPRAHPPPTSFPGHCSPSAHARAS